MLVGSNTPLIVSWLEGLGAGTVLVVFLGKILAKMWTTAVTAVVKTENANQAKTLKKELAEDLQAQWSKDLEPILKEISPNSGTSMKDLITKTSKDVTDLGTRFEKYHQDNDERVEAAESRLRVLEGVGA